MAAVGGRNRASESFAIAARSPKPLALKAALAYSEGWRFERETILTWFCVSVLGVIDVLGRFLLEAVAVGITLIAGLLNIDAVVGTTVFVADAFEAALL